MSLIPFGTSRSRAFRVQWMPLGELPFLLRRLDDARSGHGARPGNAFTVAAVIPLLRHIDASGFARDARARAGARA